MRILPQPLMCRPVWRRQLLALVGLMLLSGCANGDFGEVKPMLVNDNIHDWVGREAITGRSISASNFNLTDDERALRDLAYPLIEPPYDRQQWYSVAGEYGLIRPGRREVLDRTAYLNHLMLSRYRSPAARYAQLIDDIRNDTTRIPQFFETAGRVVDIDQKRRKSLVYVSALSHSERNNALNRIRENARIVSMVRASLVHRASSYRFALERLVIMTPSRQAVEAEQSLNQLQARIERYRTHLPPSWVREQSLAAAN
jgi:hypothetical protein